MTGKSDLSRPCLKYYRKLIGALLITGGGALMLEHLFQFDGFDVELLGHEFFGLVMIVIGYLLCLKWEQMKGVAAAWKDRDLHKLIDEGERE